MEPKTIIAPSKLFQIYSSPLGQEIKLVQDDLNSNLNKLKDESEHIASFAFNYDYNEDIKGNGYRSFMKIIEKFEHLALGHNQNYIEAEKLIKISNFLLKISKFIRSIHQQAIQSNEPNLFLDSEDLFFDVFEMVMKNQGELKEIHGTHCSFWLPLQNVLKFYKYLVVVLRYGLKGWLTHGSDKCFINFSFNSPPGFIKYLWSLELPFSKTFYAKLVPYLLHGLKPEILIDFSAPKQREWTLKSNGELIYRDGSNDNSNLVDLVQNIYLKNSIKCRLLFCRGSSNGHQKTIVLHFHGGGFLAQSAEDQDIYLRGWAQSLPGVPIISVNYTLSSENVWPYALQDCLDVYLWLMSGVKDVEDLIGFQPINIILCGDSAGAVLTFNITFIVNDIIKRSKLLPEKGLTASIKLRKPLGILSIYPIANFKCNESPSRLLSLFDSLITPGVLLSSLGAYLLPQYNNELKQISKSKSWISSWITYFFDLINLKLAGDFPNTWYSDHGTNFKSGIQIINKKSIHPYISPINYNDFESLDDVQLTLLVGEFDPLLDDSVVLAKKWKGNVTLDILPDLSHGFLYFPVISKESTEATAKCLSRLIEIINIERFE